MLLTLQSISINLTDCRISRILLIYWAILMLHIAPLNSRHANTLLMGVGVLRVVVRSLSLLRVGTATG